MISGLQVVVYLMFLQWNRHVNHPVLGMELISFYAADLVTMEKMTQKFPNVCQGVLVTKVSSLLSLLLHPSQNQGSPWPGDHDGLDAHILK